jgi:putative endonuclease
VKQKVRRSRLSAEETLARARDAERRRDDRQYKLHRGSLEDEIADKPPTPNVIGAEAEDRAVAALEAEGYEIIKRNWKRDLGELDVVARDGNVLVFVEVRSREDDAHGHAAEMVSWQKRAKVSKVAYLYLVLERPAYEEARFDVVAVTGQSVEIIKDAWRT